MPPSADSGTAGVRRSSGRNSQLGERSEPSASRRHSKFGKLVIGHAEAAGVSGVPGESPRLLKKQSTKRERRISGAGLGVAETLEGMVRKGTFDSEGSIGSDGMSVKGSTKAGKSPGMRSRRSRRRKRRSLTAGPSDDLIDEDTIPEDKPRVSVQVIKRPYAWFDPARMKLHQIDPRAILNGGMAREAYSAKSDTACSRFRQSCLVGSRMVPANKSQYTMLFAGTVMVTNVPAQGDEAGFYEEDEESVSSEESEDNDRLSNYDEEEEEEEEESRSVTSSEDVATDSRRSSPAGRRGSPESGGGGTHDDDEYSDDGKNEHRSGSQTSSSSSRSGSASEYSGSQESGSGSRNSQSESGSSYGSDSRGSSSSRATSQADDYWNVFWKKGGKNAQQDKALARAMDAPYMYMCNRKNHPGFLRERVYMRRCNELSIRVNSGVEDLLVNSTTCFCNLETVSFRDLMLGDRGIKGVVPLFRSARRIKSLSLAGNGIREKGLIAIAKALQDKSILLLLSVLDLSHNPITGTSCPELMGFLNCRRSLLMMGLMGTSLPGVRRQRLLRQTMACFAAADPNDMCKAWQLASPGTGFADCELWVQCTPIVEDRCTREQLAECMELIASYKAGETGQDSPYQTRGSGLVKQKTMERQRSGSLASGSSGSQVGMQGRQRRSSAVGCQSTHEVDSRQSTATPGSSRPLSSTPTPGPQTTMDLIQALMKDRDPQKVSRPLSALASRPSAPASTLPRFTTSTPPPLPVWGREYRRAVLEDEAEKCVS